MEIVNRDFRNNVVFTGATQILTILCHLLISIILARAFSVQGRGEYSLALLIPGFLITFVSFGLGESTASLLGKDRYPRDKIIGCLNLYLVVFGGISALIYYGLAQSLLGILKQNISRQLYYIAFVAVPVSLCWNAYASILLALGKIKQVGVGRLINNLVFIFLCLFLFKVVRPIPQIAIVVFIISGIAEVIYVAYFIKEYIKIGFCFNKHIMRDQIVFGLKFSLGMIFTNINKRVDNFFVNAFVGTYGVGIYAIAVGLTEFLLHIPHIFSRVAFSYAVTQKDAKAILTTKAIRQTMFLLVIIAILVGIFLKGIINVFYTARFADAFIPGIVLLPGIVALGLGIVIGSILTGYGKPEVGSKAMGIASIFTIILDIVLIPLFGIVGAALASTVSYTCGAVYLLIVYKRFSQKSISEILLIKKEDIQDYLGELRRFISLKR